jgi:hypothetical protein
MTIKVLITHDQPGNKSIFVRAYMWNQDLTDAKIQIYQVLPGGTYEGYVHGHQSLEIVEGQEIVEGVLSVTN